MGPTVVVFNLGPERGGDLTGVAVVNGEAIRSHRLAQGGVAVRVEVEAVARVQAFTSNEEAGGRASGGAWLARSELQ